MTLEERIRSRHNTKTFKVLKNYFNGKIPENIINKLLNERVFWDDVINEIEEEHDCLSSLNKLLAEYETIYKTIYDKDGYVYIYFSVEPSQQRLLNIYKKYGFSFVCRRRDKYYFSSAPKETLNCFIDKYCDNTLYYIVDKDKAKIISENGIRRESNPLFVAINNREDKDYILKELCIENYNNTGILKIYVPYYMECFEDKNNKVLSNQYRYVKTNLFIPPQNIRIYKK